MATMYYNNATTDGLWQTLGNWWTTSPGVGAAVTLPAVGDTVLLTGAVTQSSYSATVANLTITNFTLNMNLTVSGSATFTGTAKNAGVVAGTCVFQTTSENLAAANVLGGCTFSTSAKNYGTVTGITVFDNASTNESGGVIQGSCSFNSTASHKVGATINGNPTFNSSSTCAGAVNGAATFNTSASQTSTSVIVGQCAFNNSSILGGTVTGSCTFLSTASISSSGIVKGSSSFVMFLGAGTCAGSLTCQTVTFFGAGTAGATSVITVTDSANFIASSNLGTVSGDGIANFSNASSTTGTVNCAQAAFYGTSYNGSAGVMTCDSVIFEASYNDGTITADLVTFDATSYNIGVVNSNDCRIYKSSGNSTGVIVGVGNFYGSTGTGIYSTNTGGTVTGTLNAYYPATYPIGGTVTGATNYIGYNFVGAAPSMGFLGTVKMVLAAPISLGSMRSIMGMTGRVGINGPQTVGNAFASMGFFGGGKITLTDPGFTVSQALSAIFNLWGGGCGDGCDTVDTPRGRAAMDILNGCLQEIILNAKEMQYLSRETITVLLYDFDPIRPEIVFYEIPNNVQALVGPVTIKTIATNLSIIARQAVGVSTKSQLYNFSNFYNTGGNRSFYGYWVDRAFQSSGDRTRIRVYLSEEIVDGVLVADVEREALRYRASDCVNGTVIPLPHQYAESLLLPLLREAACASTYASRRDSFPMYQTAATAARTRYKLADPQNVALEPEPERKRKP